MRVLLVCQYMTLLKLSRSKWRVILKGRSIWKISKITSLLQIGLRSNTSITTETTGKYLLRTLTMKDITSHILSKSTKIVYFLAICTKARRRRGFSTTSQENVLKENSRTTKRNSVFRLMRRNFTLAISEKVWGMGKASWKMLKLCGLEHLQMDNFQLLEVGKSTETQVFFRIVQRTKTEAHRTKKGLRSATRLSSFLTKIL